MADKQPTLPMSFDEALKRLARVPKTAIAKKQAKTPSLAIKAKKAHR